MIHASNCRPNGFHVSAHQVVTVRILQPVEMPGASEGDGRAFSTREVVFEMADGSRFAVQAFSIGSAPIAVVYEGALADADRFAGGAQS